MATKNVLKKIVKNWVEYYLPEWWGGGWSGFFAFSDGIDYCKSKGTQHTTYSISYQWTYTFTWYWVIIISYWASWVSSAWQIKINDFPVFQIIPTTNYFSWTMYIFCKPWDVVYNGIYNDSSHTVGIRVYDYY